MKTEGGHVNNNYAYLNNISYTDDVWLKEQKMSQGWRNPNHVHRPVDVNYLWKLDAKYVAKQEEWGRKTALKIHNETIKYDNSFYKGCKDYEKKEYVDASNFYDRINRKGK